ncbi:MAG: TolC family protein [Phycisphaerales bacterium]
MNLECVYIAVCLAVVAGCGPGPLDDDYWPQASPLGRDLDAVRVPAEPTAVPLGPAFVEPRGELNLRTSLSAGLLHNPQLASFAWNVRAQEAAIIQAGLYPNPEVAVEIENFGGTDGFGGFGASETTIAIGQTILLGGKLESRRQFARFERDLAGWDYEVARVDVITRVGIEFVNTLTAQAHLAVARETAALADQVFSAIDQRVHAGKVSPVERTKARVDRAQSQRILLVAEREVVAARYRLAATWGSVTPSFVAAVGDLLSVSKPPALEELLARIEDNPDLARWTTEMAARRAAVTLARADAVPDITPFGGVKLLDGADETAFVAGIAMPIPAFDRNQGEILEARLRGAQGEALRRAAALRVKTELVIVYQALDTAYLETVSLNTQVEPSAESALAAADEAFRQGKIGALDLLDAQRTLFAVRRQSVDAHAAYHLAVVSIERLIGGPLQPTTQHPGDKS